MRNSWQKNPLDSNRPKYISILGLRIKLLIFSQRINRELMKKSEERDMELLNELYETTEYIRSTLAARISKPRRQKSESRIFAYACAAVALVLVLSLVAQLSGLRIWTAIMQGDLGYIKNGYSTPRSHYITETVKFESMAAAYDYISLTLKVPEAFMGTEVQNVSLAPSEEFSTEDMGVVQLNTSYTTDDGYMDVQTFIPDNETSSVFSTDYPVFYISQDGVLSVDEFFDKNESSDISSFTDRESDPERLVERSTRRMGNDFSPYIRQTGNVLSIRFIFENRLYDIRTDMQPFAIDSMIKIICGQESLGLLG